MTKRSNESPCALTMSTKYEYANWNSSICYTDANYVVSNFCLSHNQKFLFEECAELFNYQLSPVNII